MLSLALVGGGVLFIKPRDSTQHPLPGPSYHPELYAQNIEKLLSS